MVAARIILDRLVPPRKGRPVPLGLPTVTTAGDLTPEEASAVSSVLEGHRKMVETEELAARLQRLEERVGAGR